MPYVSVYVDINDLSDDDIERAGYVSRKELNDLRGELVEIADRLRRGAYECMDDVAHDVEIAARCLDEPQKHITHLGPEWFKDHPFLKPPAALTQPNAR